MHASNIMVSEVVTCGPDDSVETALDMLYDNDIRVLPVVDAERKILGTVSARALLSRIVPDYIASGDLDPVHFAPDIGLLRRRFREHLPMKVTQVMDAEPAIVKEGESLLAITSELIAHNRYEYVLVADDACRLKGVISCNDILRALKQSGSGGDANA